MSSTTDEPGTPAPETDLAELRKMAEAANQRPWITAPAFHPAERDVCYIDDSVEFVGELVAIASDANPADAEFIAACDPPTALALIAEVESLRAGRQPSGLGQVCNEQSRLLDGSYPTTLDPEAHRWRRCAKVSEEAGEVIEALLGLSGENPRKGLTHTLNDVRKELLDVAFAALCAAAHLDGNQGDVIADLDAHARSVLARLACALSESHG